MGISFKVSKTGSRFRPKPPPETTVTERDEIEESNNPNLTRNESNSAFMQKNSAEFNKGKDDVVGESDNEVSFTLSLFPDGFCIAKPLEKESGDRSPIDIPKFLYPYNRTSEPFFASIECGRLPGEILDDIPCKYINGTLLCEVRDYRKCFPDSGVEMAPSNSSPVVHKVRLKMSMENIVKDIPLISDGAWTYGDMIEVESRVLKALQPQLCLDPTPKLEGVCSKSVPSKLSLSLQGLRRKRLRQIPEVAVTVNNKTPGKRICTDRILESSKLENVGALVNQPANEYSNSQNNSPGNVLVQRTNSFGSDASIPASHLTSHQSKYQVGVGSPRFMQDNRTGGVSNLASPAAQDMITSYLENMNATGASALGRRDIQDGQSSPLSNLNKKPRLSQMGADTQQQHVGSQMEGLHGPDSQLKNMLLQQRSVGRGMQYANTGSQGFPHQMFEGDSNQEAGKMPFFMGQQGVRYGLKEEPAELEKLDRPDVRQTMNPQQSQLQRLPQQLMSSGFSQAQWSSLGQHLENNSRNEDHFQKRKLVQSPRVSAGGLPQSPLSSISGELSSGSVGPQFGVCVTNGLVASQKDMLAVASAPPAAGASLASSVNDTLQRQYSAQLAPKRRSSFLPKNAATSGAGSPASVSNISASLSVGSPPVGTSSLADQTMLERFSKIEMVTARFQLNCKKNKADPVPKANTTYPAQHLSHLLSRDSNNDNIKDETFPLSKSLVGGSTNTSKIRVMTFGPMLPGNGFAAVPRMRVKMIMSEKSNNGTVAMHIGEIEDAEYLAAEDYLPTLPSSHIADLLAAQFASLINREGYRLEEDGIRLKPVHANRDSSSQLTGPAMPSHSVGAEMRQYSDGVSGQSNDIAKTSNTGSVSVNSPQNGQGSRMLIPGNAQSLQISQGLLPGVSMGPRPQQSDLPPLQQQQQSHQSLMQQQHSLYQRPSFMLAANQMSPLNTMGQNSNTQLGNPTSNKPSPSQLQQQSQQQQAQLQPQQQQTQQLQSAVQRKMMMGLGTMGMGSIGNNMVGMGGLSNVMGMGSMRGIGGTGISAPISGMGNVAPNSMNLTQVSNISNVINQQLRSGAITQEQAAIFQAKLRMSQNRTNMLGGPQSGLAGVAGARQIHPGSTGLSMLSPALNRANINSLQRTAVGQMGPPKLITGMNPYMNQQQQLQLQLQQQQMQLQQQPQLQQQQVQLQQHQQPQPQQQHVIPQQQQQTASPLQSVVSPPPVGSPSSMRIPTQINLQQQQLQQPSPQQMNQRTPMSPQLSSGAIQPASTGNPEACPASPQLSSQTLGSVGSISNSPLELQGVHKTNSSGNA